MVSFFHVDCSQDLLHDELLSVATSADEVNTGVEAADVDAVVTNVTFNVHHVLTHDVVDHDVSILVEGDVELLNGGVGIEAHCRVADRVVFFNAVIAKEVEQAEGEALVEVVGTVAIVTITNHP